MANDPFNSSPPAGGYTLGSSIDVGLQSFMQSVYRSMTLGLALTGFIAYFIAATPALAAVVFTKGVVILALVVLFGLGLFTAAALAQYVRLYR